VQYDLVLHTITSHCNVSSQREQKSREIPGFFFQSPPPISRAVPHARPLKLAIGV
jgi:hypothetical protein